MRAVIIGNGDILNYEYIKSRLKPDDYYICADGGVKHTKGLGITPSVVIGDFDSSKQNESFNNRVFPVAKNFTDGELAVDYAIENGFSQILLVAMTGKRLDHTLTNIFQLVKRKGISLIDDMNEVFFIDNYLQINNKAGKTLSIIPLSNDLCGVTITGVLYPLENDILRFGYGRGNSNKITNELCTISVKSGKGVAIINNGE